MITQRRSLIQKKGQRTSISAEVYGIFNKKENFKPRVIPKTMEQRHRITEIITQSFIFNSLDEKDLNKVIDAMEEVSFKKDQIVVKQGDDGDALYLVEKGNLDCFKFYNNDSHTGGQKQIFLKTYGPGEVFGELALLYNSPRAATIKAKEDCVLCSLDRETFNHIVKEASIKKRDRYETFLKSVNILSSIDSYEISQIADALKIEKARAGEYIIRMKEEGDKFYILEEGVAYASKKLNRNIHL
jgi:cAMP-dependent protein kinase regulator